VDTFIDNANSTIQKITGPAQSVMDQVVSVIEQYLGTQEKRDEIYGYVMLALNIL
jgi:hypothetical protein